MADTRRVPGVHALRKVEPDAADELALATELRGTHTRESLLELASRHAHGDSAADERMRRATWRALARSFGHGVRINRGAICRHPETFEIGDGVFVGEQAVLQGRFDGRCVIGNYCWIGPQA